MKNDPCFALFHNLVIFALCAPERCAVFGTRAVAHATATTLTVLRCVTLWANSYACLLGMNIVIVTVICFIAVRMMAIRKGSLVGTESTDPSTHLMSRVYAVSKKLFVSQSCTE